MNYQQFKKSVSSSKGYLILPKFLFKDKAMLMLMDNLRRESIDIFHTYKAFKSNAEWQKSWADKEFRSQFHWALCYTLPDGVIGAGCFSEIGAFLRFDKRSVYHVTFSVYYHFSQITGVTAPFVEEDFRRYAQVITDDQISQGLETFQTTGKIRQDSGNQKA